MEVAAFISVASAVQEVNAGHNLVKSIDGNMFWGMCKSAVIPLAPAMEKITANLNER